MRPYLQECLQRMAELYEVVVFTAGLQDYADKILDKVDPERKLIKKRLYRNNCINVEEYFIKDLDIFLDRDKKDIIIVDNSIMSFAFDLDNGVPINSYMGTEEDDRELLYLISFLEEAFYQDDVRPHILKSFSLSQLLATVLNP
jgi:CTD small phosphatase-like protein 2